MRDDALRRFHHAIDHWQLADLTVMQGGCVGLVVAADYRRQPHVLKVNPRTPAGWTSPPGEGRALALWAERGVSPEVIGMLDDELTVLMRRARPGIPLARIVPETTALLRILGDTCRQVHLTVDPGAFPHLSEGDEATGWRRSLAGTPEHTFLEELLASSDDDRLVHVDLHAENVLRHDDRWLVIDPKPHIGDPCVDVVAFVFGSPRLLAEVPDDQRRRRRYVADLTGLYARQAGLDADRVRAWVSIRALARALKAEREDDQAWAVRAQRLLMLVDALDA